MINLQEIALEIKNNKYSKARCLENWAAFRLHSFNDNTETYELSDDTYIIFVNFNSVGKYLSMSYNTYGAIKNEEKCNGIR